MHESDPTGVFEYEEFFMFFYTDHTHARLTPNVSATFSA